MNKKASLLLFVGISYLILGLFVMPSISEAADPGAECGVGCRCDSTSPYCEGADEVDTGVICTISLNGDRLNGDSIDGHCCCPGDGNGDGGEPCQSTEAEICQCIPGIRDCSTYLGPNYNQTTGDCPPDIDGLPQRCCCAPRPDQLCSSDQRCDLTSPYCEGADEEESGSTCRISGQSGRCCRSTTNGGDNGDSGGPGIILFENPLETDTFKDAVDKVVNLIFRVAVVVAPLMIIVGGFFIVTAAGSAEQISRGKKIILWTIVGFIIVLLARGISNLIEIIIGI